MSNAVDQDSTVIEGKSDDDLLCYCDGMGPDGDGLSLERFETEVWNYPELEFDSMLDQLNIGKKCTACLINVESRYYRALQNRPANYVSPNQPEKSSRPTTHPDEPKSLKQKIYGLIDDVAPEQPITRLSVVPCVSGKGVRTVLTLSNCYPEKIGPEVPTYRYELKHRDSTGKLTSEQSFELPAGESRDVEVGPSADGESIVSGSTWVHQTPLAPGYAGSTRPHFKLVSAGGISAVHSQVKNSRVSSQVLARANRTEHHLIHAVNLEDQPNAMSLRIWPLDGDEAKAEVVEHVVPPFGSMIIEIPDVVPEDQTLYKFELSSSLQRRSHIMIADADYGMMSADHF